MVSLLAVNRSTVKGIGKLRAALIEMKFHTLLYPLRRLWGDFSVNYMEKN